MAIIKIWIKFDPGASETERNTLVALSPGSEFKVGVSRLGVIASAVRQPLPPDEGIFLDVSIADLNSFQWLKDLKLPGVVTGA